MNIELHDSVLGDGPDVVLLHGLFGQGSNLGSIARALQTEFRVHSPDLPDHGHSPWTDDPSIAGYAEAVGHWMATRDIPRAHVLGHSLGGKVAMELALSYPSLVDKLVDSRAKVIAPRKANGKVRVGLVQKSKFFGVIASFY